MLRIARVQTALDRNQARITFEMALEEARRLSGRDRDSLLEEARFVGAAVAPDLLEAIVTNLRGPRAQFTSETLVRIMLDHGHVDAAVDYVSRYVEPSAFPFGYVSNLLHQLDEQERRLALLRHATEVWRTTRDQMLFGPDRFIPLYAAHWEGSARRRG
jgi:hypothetical protein